MEAGYRYSGQLSPPSPKLQRRAGQEEWGSVLALGGAFRHAATPFGEAFTLGELPLLWRAWLGEVIARSWIAGSLRVIRLRHSPSSFSHLFCFLSLRSTCAEVPLGATPLLYMLTTCEPWSIDVIMYIEASLRKEVEV